MTASVKNLNADTTTADLHDQIATLRADLGALTQIISDLAQAKGDEAASTVKDKIQGASDTVADQIETARLHAMDTQSKAEDFIRTQPATALGVAAGVGFLIGFLGSRK